MLGFYQAPCLDRHAALNMEPRLISIWVFWTGELSHFPFKFSNPKKKSFSTQSSLPRRAAAFSVYEFILLNVSKWADAVFLDA